MNHPKIVQKDAPVLRETASAVSEDMFGSDELKKIIADMSRALDGEYDGVALAAPQIGVSLRLFVVSKRIFEDAEEDLVFINPKIVKTSKETEEMHEGCLSVRPLYGKVTRHTKATIEAYDFGGKKFSYGASGLLAQIFQHETDHLDGILFIDTAKDLQEDAEYLKRMEEKLKDN